MQLIWDRSQVPTHAHYETYKHQGQDDKGRPHPWDQNLEDQSPTSANATLAGPKCESLLECLFLCIALAKYQLYGVARQ